MSSPFCNRHIETFFSLFQQGTAPLDLSLSRYFRTHRALGAKDRKIVGDTIYGIIRWQSLFDWAHIPLEKRPALYQSEAFKSLQNDPAAPEAARLGIPDWLFKRFLHQFGKSQGRKISHILNTPAPVTLRANPLKTTRESLLQFFGDEAIPSKRAPYGIQLNKRLPLFSLPEFKQGFFEMQDEGSQLVAEEVQAKPGDLVLDFCSGSGGKTLAFAHRMQGKGQIYLHDIRPSVLKEAKERLRRAGIQNGQFLTPDHVQLKKLKGKCNWVLIDLPCSGTGTFRRNPDQKWRLNETAIERLVVEQRTIAKEALAYLKEGGHLVYATCSLLHEENEDQVKYLTDNFPLTLVKDPLLLLPELGGMDGFFTATFKKNTN